MAGSVPLILTIAALLAGCGGSDDETPRSQSTAVTGTTAEPGLEGASTAPAVWAGSSSQVDLLTDVRVAAHAGYDRIVLQFRSGPPGYDLRYVKPPVRADGSGAEVKVHGAAVLRIRMEPALDADLTQESAPRTYTGPTRFAPPAPTIVELVRTGGFEAVLTWVVGVDKMRPFRVTRLERPARLVIDIARG